MSNETPNRKPQDDEDYLILLDSAVSDLIDYIRARLADRREAKGYLRDDEIDDILDDAATRAEDPDAVIAGEPVGRHLSAWFERGQAPSPPEDDDV